MRPRLVMMSSIPPGAGKSTLMESLAERLRAHGAAVDCFGEEQLFTRPAFDEAAEGFRTKNFPAPETLVAGYTTTFDDLRAANAWGIFDWACSAMAADLPWALRDYDRLVRHCREVRELAADLDPILLDLTIDSRVAVERAYAQRGQPFADLFLRAATETGHLTGTTVDRIVRWCEQQRAELYAVELKAMRTAGWPIVTLDAARPAERVLDDAWSALGG